MFGSEGWSKAIWEHQLSQNGGSGVHPRGRLFAKGPPDHVVIPGPKGTISPHEPVIKVKTGTGFHAS
jgi:hypothetical protein